MQGVIFQTESNGAQGFALAVGLACLMGVAPVSAQVADPPLEKPSTTRLLTVEEGRSIAAAALQQEQPAGGGQDCSHLAHQVYLNAGFAYPYASSFELFAGNENFTRVKFPHAGDLIVWPGHVGIVVDPSNHSFSSLVSTGLDVQDYESAYWKSRGRSRFYRYKVQRGAILTAAKTPASPQIPNAKRQRSDGTMIEERSAGDDSALNQGPKTASERTILNYGPPVPDEATEPAAPFVIPSSIVVAAASKPPTREEVAEGISELNDAAATLLRSDDPFQARLPVVIVEQFSVVRVETKRDHGWARLQIESKVSIGSGAMQKKLQREDVRWELRRMPSGWEVVAPADRTYVPHDVAVKDLAAQLAQLTQSNAATAHQITVLRQESHIATLLSTLLEIK